MPLQNRVDPFGAILAAPERGTMMGNRGGRIHDGAKRLTRRRWTSRRWICCELEFRGLDRQVMGEGYTELFFLDEVTALAAGHRPCFYCRHAEATSFARAFPGGPSPPGADEMDRLLHAERLEGMAKRIHRGAAAGLPDGSAAEGTPVPAGLGVAPDTVTRCAHATSWPADASVGCSLPMRTVTGSRVSL